jgi:hypothetical protein
LKENASNVIATFSRHFGLTTYVFPSSDLNLVPESDASAASTGVARSTFFGDFIGIAGSAPIGSRSGAAKALAGNTRRAGGAISIVGVMYVHPGDQQSILNPPIIVVINGNRELILAQRLLIIARRYSESSV